MPSGADAGTNKQEVASGHGSVNMKWRCKSDEGAACADVSDSTNGATCQDPERTSDSFFGQEKAELSPWHTNIMFCAISGEVPEEPVVSKKSGHVFEKRLILKSIQDDGQDPVTQEELTEDDLLEVKTNKVVKPRPPSATSIPGLLGLFQNEWDDLMLETYTLKKHLDTTRQELSQALYQHDAACRVIARLIKERDAAREQLAAAQAHLARTAAQAADGSGAEAQTMDVEPVGISADIIKKMEDKAKILSKGRRKRPVPAELVSVETIESWDAQQSHNLHKASLPGVLTVDVNPRDDTKVLSGGVDKEVKLFDLSSGTVSATLKGHSKKVSHAQFHPSADVLISASHDKTVRLWTPSQAKGGKAKGGDDYDCAFVLKDHKHEVVGASVHATGDYLASAARDGAWALHDVALGQCITFVKDPAVEKGFECVQFHPDGMLLGTGTMDALVRIWDLKSQTNVASFEGHEGQVNSIAFSENGYHMASGSADGTVRLWDLRKLKNIKTLEVGKQAVSAVKYDHSGSYLSCAAGKEISIYLTKQWDVVKTFAAHTATVTSVAFGDNASFLVSGSMDRSMKVFRA